MKTLVLLAALAIIPMKSFAAETDSSKSKCHAKEIQEFWCPSGSGWWYGPYYDRGCEVACSEGGKAVCTEARCDTWQSGNVIPSDCHCE